MFSQLYYNARTRIGLRFAALAIIIFGSVFFLFFASRPTPADQLAAAGEAFAISYVTWAASLGIIFASFGLIGLFIVSVYVTASTHEKLVKSPDNYLFCLTPVPAWKKIMGWLIPSVVFDSISVGIGILSVLILSVTMTQGESLMSFIANQYGFMVQWNVLYGITVVVLLYTLLLSAIHFASAVNNTVLVRVPLRKLISVVVTVLILCALSWSYAVLLPFGELDRFGILFNISLHNAATWHLFVVITLLLAQIAALIAAAAYLMDRRA